MTAVQYTGHFPVLYPDYVDAATGRTLEAVPGRSYIVTRAGLPAVPGDGRWGEPAREEDRLEEPAEDPPAAPEPAPAASEGESTPETTTAPAEPAGTVAAPETEE